ncbi:MAG: hypothetical protein IPJ67_01525 [Candidatus Moraniibacteriota bacterium]|nr:MAG: hypothetical protein IPJ67_01525 [Candidatus Moranbacteria bacterium]
MICPGFSDPYFFFFSSEAPPLLYYSHIPTAIIALFIGAFVYLNNRGVLAARLLLFISIAFLFWVLCDLVTWVSNDSDVIFFVWSFFGILYALISLLSVYFVYAFLDKGDVSWKVKSILSFLFFPIVLLTPTAYNLATFSLGDCGIPNEGFYFTNYYYLVGFIAFFWILFLILSRVRHGSLARDMKRQIVLFGFGIEFFLLSFFVSGFLASFLVDNGLMSDFGLIHYGLFGMPVFMGLLGYLMVRYHAFNVKVLAVQALVVGLAILIGSQLFFVVSQVNFVLTSLTFLFSILFGSMLIRSVKNEIRRKEELQIVTDKLAAANVELKRLDQSKTEFISIASHQLRTPLTAIKGFVSLLLEGSYGAVPSSISDVLDKIYTANERIVHLVEDLLNISRMESGRLKYEYAEVNVPEFLNELHDTFALVAKKKGLDLTFELPKEALPLAWIDRQKAFEVVSNLIDNALKYTTAGSVRVHAEEAADFIRISVTDTGVGIDADMMSALFQKFSRGKESGKMHVSGTGLGLYVGKSMIEAQGGRIGVTSEGSGKGSTFSVDLPVKRG